MEDEFSLIQQEAAEEREAENPKAVETARLRDAETRKAVEEITPDSVISGLAALGREVGRALADLSDK